MATKKKMLQAAAGAGPDTAWDLSYAYLDDPLAWDISKVEYTGEADNLATSPLDIYFKPDGTAYYTIDTSTDTFRQFQLTVPWSVASAGTYTSLAVGTPLQNAGNVLFFKADGTKLYGMNASNVLYQYGLTTPWNITTGSYDGVSVSLGTEDSNVHGIFIRDDGLKMYMVGSSTDSVYEYDFGTAWDLTTLSVLQSKSLAAQDTIPSGVFFKPDGTKMYMLGGSGDDLNEYSLTTPWDISTASYTRVITLPARTGNENGLWIGNNGLKLYVVDGSYLWENYVGGFSVSAQDASPKCIRFKSDGTKMFMMGYSGDSVYQYSLGTAWDLSTATYLSSFSVSGQEVNPFGLFLKPDGTAMYVAGLSGQDVNQYSLSTAWDVTTASYQKVFSVSAQDTSPLDIFFSSDGTRMFMLGNDGKDVNFYDLSTAWDVGTAAYAGRKVISTQEAGPRGMFFNPDGTKMYIIGLTGDDIDEWELSTAWLPTSAAYVQSFSVANDIAPSSIPESVAFSEDGDKMFVLAGDGNNRIYTYTLGQH